MGFKCLAAIIVVFLLLGIQAVTPLARVDNNWSHRRPNTTMPQNQWGQSSGYRPQPLPYNRNQTFVYHQSATVRPGAASVGFHNNQTYPGYPLTNQRTFNQTRPNWGQSPSVPQHPAYGQSSFNISRTGWPQPNQPAYPSHNQASNNHTRFTGTPRPVSNILVGSVHNNQSLPGWPQATIPYAPQNPGYSAAYANQSRPAWPQPVVPYVPQNPNHNQVSFNKSQPSWPQPSASQLPSNPHNPALTASNLYPQLPNNPNARPVVPSNSWTTPNNQTHLYPQLPKQNLPQPGNSSGIPLAPLQPLPNPQGPHNWHSGGQSALSYGPGYYPPLAGNTNKNSLTPPGSTNPYANMFI